jgi:hypothetical protein
MVRIAYGLSSLVIVVLPNSIALISEVSLYEFSARGGTKNVTKDRPFALDCRKHDSFLGAAPCFPALAINPVQKTY